LQGRDSDKKKAQLSLTTRSTIP